MSYITRDGMLYLKRKLLSYKKALPEIIERVATAREMGDLSENAEYHASKESQRNLEKDILLINKKLTNLQVIDTEDLSDDVIRFGFFIKLLDLVSLKHVTYRLVGPDEIDMDFEKEILGISFVSPIGKALVGKKIGEIIKVRVPSGEKKYKVLNIWKKGKINV